MENIEILRQTMNDKEIGVVYSDQQGVEIKGFGDTIDEAFENLAMVMRTSERFDHTETDEF